MVLEKKVELELMTYLEVEEAIRESGGIVIIPVAATEQHGPHLALGTDTYSTVVPAIRAAKEARVAVAPAIAYGNSRQNMPFPGTIALRSETLKELVKDVGRSLVQHGFNKIVILNGHGGNIDPLNSAAEDLKYETGAYVFQVKCWELAHVEAPPGTPKYDAHGGSQETSIMLYLHPEGVDQSKYIDSPPLFDLPETYCIWPPQVFPIYTPVLNMIDAKESSKYGHYGNPKFASKERGQKVIEAWTDALVEVLKTIRKFNLKQK